MKTFVCFFSLLLVFPYSLAAEAPEPVVDSRGEYLRNGLSYYIMPLVSGRGGGLNLANTRNKTCPLDVVQEEDENERGIPFSFTPVNPKKGVIRVSTDLNIKYNGDTSCNESLVWTLNQFDGQYFVTTGGVAGNPGAATIGNWFKIEVFIDDYKLVYCPSVCPSCNVVCKDVGIVVVNGKRYLGLTDDPRRIVFQV